MLAAYYTPAYGRGIEHAAIRPFLRPSVCPMPSEKKVAFYGYAYYSH